MDLSARRRVISSTSGEIEVSSDGRTVWVNTEVCVARFCPVSREYAALDSDGGSSILTQKDATVRHPDEGPTLADWINFVSEVNDRWGIVIGQEHTPLYIQ